MMKARNLVVFRNYPNIDEPMINSMVGYLSLKNIIVFAIFGGISFALFKLIIPDNFSIQDNPVLFIVVITPVIIGISLSLIKPKWGSADSIILSLIWVSHKNKKHNKKIKIPKKSKKKSSVLGFGDTLQPKKVSDENIIQEIRCADFDELKQLKYKLYKNDGEIYADKLVKCYLDDLLIDTLKTSLDGILLVMIRPESSGKKKLIIKTDEDDILLERFLHFKKKRD